MQIKIDNYLGSQFCSSHGKPLIEKKVPNKEKTYFVRADEE